MVAGGVKTLRPGGVGGHVRHGELGSGADAAQQVLYEQYSDFSMFGGMALISVPSSRSMRYLPIVPGEHVSSIAGQCFQ